MVKNSFIEKKYVVEAIPMCTYNIIYVTENKEQNYFKHPKLPISSKIPVTLLRNCLYLHDSYISKFEFMNYPFANLLDAWL